MARLGRSVCGTSTSAAATDLLGCDDLARGGREAACLLKKLDLKRLKSTRGPGEKNRNTLYDGLPLYAGRCSSGSALADDHKRARRWTADAERAVAREYGLELLSRYDARLPRWDLHPGVQRGKAPFYFDCAHSSFARGAFDVEASALFDAIEERFGSSRGAT